MKNYVTPRMARDGQWTTGSVSAPTEREWQVSTLLIAVVLVGSILGFVFGVIP